MNIHRMHERFKTAGQLAKWTAAYCQERHRQFVHDFPGSVTTSFGGDGTIEVWGYIYGPYSTNCRQVSYTVTPADLLAVEEGRVEAHVAAQLAAVKHAEALQKAGSPEALEAQQRAEYSRLKALYG